MRTDSLTRESVNHIKINQYDNMYVTDSRVSESKKIVRTYKVVRNDLSFDMRVCHRDISMAHASSAAAAAHLAV